MKISDLTNTIQAQDQTLKVSQEKKDEKLWKASQEMEGVFLSILVKAMEKTVPDGSLTGSKNSLSKMMFSSVMGKEIAENGGIGFAKQIYQSLKETGKTDIDKLNTLDYSQILQYIKLPEVSNDE